MERKKHVSPEQIEQARRLDLLSYLQQYEQHELVHISNGVYSTRTNDSLKISHGKWFRWSMGVGGVSALDYLIEVRDMHFVEAVLYLCDCLRFEPPKQQFMPKPPPKPTFVLPKPNENNDRVIDYLTQLGIGMALLRLCICTGRLYEDERHNCCFVGFDSHGVSRYAMLRSSAPGSTFLREVEGSDKRYSFLPPQERSHTLHLFESAIDCLSFVELQSPGNRADNYLSLSGVYQPKKELSETPLPIALMQYLKDNPHINHVAIFFQWNNILSSFMSAACLSAFPLLPKQTRMFWKKLSKCCLRITSKGIMLRSASLHFPSPSFIIKLRERTQAYLDNHIEGLKHNLSVGNDDLRRTNYA
ncbi:MAG: DUF3991 domain-containing protein [Candidatus Pelethousia sp.]|nr:DUF3991 domain-containing protein [Candidatus Pelethousia sp.]